jgi:hypothetical protein
MRPAGNEVHEIPDAFRRPSPIKVLKLHGSFGWNLRGHRVTFDNARFLREFPVKLPRQHPAAEIVDPDFEQIHMRDDFGFLYPSFLKRIDAPPIQTIWRRAADALAVADRVDILGYSLPASDGASRTLLHALANRAARNEVSVTVTDLSPESLHRWTQFFGIGSVQTYQRALRSLHPVARRRP